MNRGQQNSVVKSKNKEFFDSREERNKCAYTAKV
jgi:hypothetical protein